MVHQSQHLCFVLYFPTLSHPSLMTYFMVSLICLIYFTFSFHFLFFLFFLSFYDLFFTATKLFPFHQTYLTRTHSSLLSTPFLLLHTFLHVLLLLGKISLETTSHISLLSCSTLSTVSHTLLFQCQCFSSCFSMLSSQ